ncbi:MAG: transcriptional repressor [Verrucomicrobia bacterium]|nr:transcriptional repressor [Verrucomicrobiota bacterium]
MPISDTNLDTLNQALAKLGLRSTRQREVVYSVVAIAKDHPTADEIFVRSRRAMPTISLATVYNCLETLLECTLIRQVNFERESTRYEPNLAPHAHFYCDKTGTVMDVHLPEDLFTRLTGLLPNSTSVSSVELNFRGSLPDPAANFQN